jgi:hypothetical protein
MALMLNSIIEKIGEKIMGNDFPETIMPDDVSFHVIARNLESAEYIRAGIDKQVHRNVRGASLHYNVKCTERESGKWNVYITVLPIKAVETFTYLFHCMEFGYVMMLDMDKIVGTQKAMLPETFTRTIPGTQAEVRFTMPDKHMSATEIRRFEKTHVTFAEEESDAMEALVLCMNCGEKLFVRNRMARYPVFLSFPNKTQINSCPTCDEYLDRSNVD